MSFLTIGELSHYVILFLSRYHDVSELTSDLERGYCSAFGHFGLRIVHALVLTNAFLRLQVRRVFVLGILEHLGVEKLADLSCLFGTVVCAKVGRRKKQDGANKHRE